MWTSDAAPAVFLRIDNLKVSGDDKHAVLNLREVTAYDKDGKVIAPLTTRLSSEHSSGSNSVGNCHDGKIDDKICHSATADDNPSLVFGYRAGANISKIVVTNRAFKSVQEIRIVGASIRICSDLGPH